ncbi:MAG TPA: hypothetical protein VGF99_20880, partial [Myxococcota bacterium]
GATRIGASRDGSFAVIPNTSLFPTDDAPGFVQVDISAAGVVSVRGQIAGAASGLQTPSEAVVAPDGSVAAISDWEADAVHIVDTTGAAPRIITSLTGFGLAEQMAMITDGSFAGRVFVPEVRGAGSFVSAIDLGGGAGTRGTAFPLADEDIPVSIAVTR